MRVFGKAWTLLVESVGLFFSFFDDIHCWILDEESLEASFLFEVFLVLDIFVVASKWLKILCKIIPFNLLRLMYLIGLDSTNLHHKGEHKCRI